MGSSILPKILLIWVLLCFDSAHLTGDTQTLQPPDAAPSTSGNRNLTGTSGSIAEDITKCASSQERLISKALPPLDVSKIEMLAEDKSDPPKTFVCDPSMYTVEIVEGITATYKLKDGLGFVVVRYNTKLVWNLGPTRPYPHSLVFSINGNTMIVNFKYSRDILKFDGREWKCIFFGIPEPMSLNVLFKEESNSYNCQKTNKVYTYRAKGNSLFNKVLTSSEIAAKLEVVWQTANPQLLAYQVVYDETDDKNLLVTIYHVNGLTRTFSKKSFWSSRESRTIPSSNELTADRVKITTHGQTNLEMILEEDDDYLKYTFKEETQCASFEYGGKIVFTINAGDPQPESVYFSIRGNTVFLNFECHTIVVKLEKDKWKIVFYGIILEEGLNISKRSSTNDYDYSKEGEVHTYTAAWGHAFCSIYKGGDCLIPDAFIWNAWDYREFVIKVVYHDSNPEYFVLITYHLNGLKRILKKPKSPKWEDSKSKGSDSILSEDNVEIRTGSKVVPLPPERDDSKPPTTDRFESASETTESSIELPEGVVFAKDDHYLKYTFKDGVRCIGVKYDRKDVWNHQPNNPYPKSVYFTIKKNMAFVNFKESMKIVLLSDSGCESIYNGNGEANLLDISKTLSNDFFDYSKEGEVHTYTAKDNHLFCSVFKKGSGTNSKYEMIWQTEYFDDVADKVVLDETKSNNKVLTIHQVNGTIRTLMRNASGGEWEESEAKESKYEIKPEKVEIIVEYQVVAPVLDANAEESEILTLPSITSTFRTRVDLDIRTRRCTAQFDYSESYKFWTYTAKGNCYFRSVSDGNAEIWRGRAYCLSATKVAAELDSSASLVGLTLHFVNGRTRRFNVSDGKLHEWTYRDPTYLRPFSEPIIQLNEAVKPHSHIINARVWDH